MDTDISKSDWYLAIMIFLNGVRIIVQLHMLKKQAQKGEITKENLEISSAVKTLIKLDRYASEYLENIKKRYWRK